MPFTLTNSPELGPVSSLTATHSRAGTPPPAGVHITSVQMSLAFAAVLNGAAGTAVHAAAGPPVRIHSPPLVAATKVVVTGGGGVGSAASLNDREAGKVLPFDVPDLRELGLRRGSDLAQDPDTGVLTAGRAGCRGDEFARADQHFVGCRTCAKAHEQAAADKDVRWSRLRRMRRRDSPPADGRPRFAAVAGEPHAAVAGG